MTTTCWASQAADQEAARIDQADRRDEFVAKFTQDATDKVLSEDGNCHWLLGAVETIEPLFLAALWSSPEDAFTKIVALRDALRAAALQNKATAADIARRAEKLADAADESAADDAAWQRFESRWDGPAFPSLRGGL